jgi:hypothetical protein
MLPGVNGQRKRLIEMNWRFVTACGIPLLASRSLLAQSKIPNDPYYQHQYSFHNPGGKVRMNILSCPR